MSLFRLLLPFVFLLGSTVLAEPLPLRDGEALVYRVSWGLFGHAGEIVIAAKATELEGLPQLQVSTVTATRGFIRTFFPFDGYAESTFDARDQRLLAANATTTAGRKKTRASIVFDYAADSASYVDHLRPNRTTTVPLPEGRPMDLITSLVQTRTWDLNPGDKRSMLVLFDDDFYDLTVTAERIERISTPDGEREALLLVPRMEKDPKGMFKRGGEVRVWISRDAQRLPLKFDVKLGVGTGTATLVDYRAPAAAVNGAAAQDPVAPAGATHANPRP